MVWIAPQTPPDERPHPDAAAIRTEIDNLSAMIPEALTTADAERLRARIDRLRAEIGDEP